MERRDASAVDRRASTGSRRRALRRTGVVVLAAGGFLTGLAALQLTGGVTARAGYSTGSDCKVFGQGSFKGLSAECPTAYIPATTDPAQSYTPGQTFTFSVVIHNRTGSDITAQLNWGYSHILTIQDSSSGQPPLTTIDVSDGTTPSGYIPVTDYNWFAYGLWQNAVEKTLVEGPSFGITVPANGSITLARTGSFNGCGYIQLDLGGAGVDAIYGILSGGVTRVLGCTTPTPPVTTTSSSSTTTSSSSTTSTTFNVSASSTFNSSSAATSGSSILPPNTGVGGDGGASLAAGLATITAGFALLASGAYGPRRRGTRGRMRGSTRRRGSGG